jgi:hypothetical protein
MDHMNKVRIGAASATFVDSRMAMPQLLGGGGKIDFLVFDCLAEGVMGALARARSAGQPAYVADFIDGQIMPHIAELMDRKIRIVANAGGLDPGGCAAALKAKAATAGYHPKIAWVAGDDLSDRVNSIVNSETRDMFDDAPVRAQLDQGDKFLSLCAYTGGFPIAAALDAGADIVITGRAVDSATSLGALIHAFGWGPDDFDKLAAGTLIGHLLECTTQMTGGTFTDWEQVPDWVNIGFPIAECAPDGSAVFTKPEGTGGLITPATIAEQMLYEVSDPQRYAVPDVVCDFSDVRIEQVGQNEARVTGARGFGRPEKLKATLTWDKGWRAIALAPIIGHRAADKARRVADSLMERTSRLLRDRQMPPWSLTHRDIVGGEGPGASTALCRMVVDHPDPQGVQLFARESSSIMTNMAVGLTVPLGTTIRPITQISGFLIPRDQVPLTVTLDGKDIPFIAQSDGGETPTTAPAEPQLPLDSRDRVAIPLIALAWARSGDKGNLFNVGVIARDPEFLPFLFQALTPEAIGAHYGQLLNDGKPLMVERFSVPGIHALNLVVHGSLQGGMLASASLDPAAKGMAQLLLDFPVPVSSAIAARLVTGQPQEAFV